MGKKLNFVEGLALSGLAMTLLICNASMAQSAKGIGVAEPISFTAAAGSSSLAVQEGSASAAPVERWQPPASAASKSLFSSLGIGVKVSPLGVGAEAAAPLWDHANLRLGGNFFNFSDNFSQDGFSYHASLRFRSAQASFDWFPFRNGFHLSPGVLLYNGNQVTATPRVQGGQTFTLDDTDYVSSAADPIKGSGKLGFAKAGPMFTVGWGNLVPRGERHFSFPFEIGFAYVGEPTVAFHLTGSACNAGGIDCRVINDDPTFQANVRGQERKIRDDISPLRFYPILSTGIGYRF